MSDIARRLAEACERAAAVLNAHAEANATSSRGAAMAADVSDIRALAAALRGAVEVSSLDGTRIVNVVITIGDA